MSASAHQAPSSATPRTPTQSSPTWPLGAAIAIAALAVDQAVKLWLIYGFDLGARGFYALTRFLDLVLVWNTGISYGLFPQEGPVGRAVLLSLKMAALIVLIVWLVRTHSRLTAASLGLIIGGAIGNGIDRLVFGAVADFFFFHLDQWNFRWYVFNLADVAIVAGVLGILFETLRGEHAAKAP